LLDRHLLDGRLVACVRMAWPSMSASMLISMKAAILAATSKAADEGLVVHLC